MPFSTGTADTAVDLQVKLNTHLTANGWTKLTGETNQNCVSPMSARYWRILIEEPEASGDLIEVELLEWRTTLSGANQATDGSKYKFNIAPASGVGADLVSGTTPVISPDLNDAYWSIRYDFGSPIIIRELMIKCDTDDYAPRAFFIQFSQDDVTWTTMQYYDTGITWVDDETKVFQFDDGTLYADHFSGTRCRRLGYNSNFNSNPANHGIFAWQGPGYDAARRVYINCTTNYTLSSSVERWILGGGTTFDAASISPWNNDNLGADQNYDPRHIMPLGPFTYWIYSNSIRVIVIVKKGLDDYTSMYMGFMKAFAIPDSYPFPLFIGATADTDSDYSENNADLSSFCDPGSNAARWRDWDGVWSTAQNRISSPQEDLYHSDPGSYIWPYHCGSNGDGSFPISVLGDNDTFSQHWMDRVVPTVQGELPMFPCIVMDDPYGAVGALDGVFAIPRGDVLSAEQVITISGQNYRIFTNRDRSNGNHYFAIRED